jgi:hypothetical protein
LPPPASVRDRRSADLENAIAQCLRRKKIRIEFERRRDLPHCGRQIAVIDGVTRRRQSAL